MNKLTLTFFAVVLISISYGQQKYPLEVLPGKTIQLKSEGDTLWVINNSQMQKSIANVMSLAKADSIFSIFQAEIKTLQRVIQQKNDIIKKNKDGYNHYLELWKESDKKLEEEEKKVEKVKKRNKIWTGIGFASGLLIAFTLKSVI